MDHPPVAAKKCILKVNIHCRECEGRATRALRKVAGVYSVVVDGHSGKATVIGNMDPFKLIKALKKKGKTAEILQYMDALPEPPLLPQQPPAAPADNQNKSNVKDSHLAQMAHPQNLSSIDKMKQVEVTHSKSLKVTFKDSENGLNSKSNIVTGDVQSHHHNGGGASGASCSVASSSSGQDPSMTGGEGGGPLPYGHRNHHMQQAPNPMANPYHHCLFANEHLDGCNLMGPRLLPPPPGFSTYKDFSDPTSTF